MALTLAIKKAIERDPSGYAASLKKLEFKKLLDELDDLYHEQGVNYISDESYDILRENYEARFGTRKKVGAPVKSGAKVRLPVPMGSLNKIKPGSAVLSTFLAAGGPFVASDKEDGISIELLYDHKILQRAFTRGDGVTGKDASGVIPALRAPKRISEPDEFIVRGEFTADRSVFDAHFAEDFATSRNLGGGLLNRNQPSESVSKFKFVAYEILKGRGAGSPLSKQLAILKELGFTVVPYKVYPKLTEEKLVSLHNARKGVGGAKRDIDGIVIARDVNYKVGIGNPTHAYAFKINALENSVLVTVKDVVWEESRYGRLIPRILIEPTTIGGVTVTYFTGHNNFYIEHGYKYELRKKPPYEARPINKGAEIRAIRSGDVIPYIMEVVTPAKTPSKPKQPFKVDGVHLVAVHEEKSDLRHIKELTHFFVSLGVEGLKQGVITQLVNSGIDTVKKILNAKVPKLMQLEGFQRKKAETLVANLQLAKQNMTFVNVAVGSAVFGDKIGQGRLEALEKAIPDILDRANLPERDLVSAIQSVRGFKELAVPIAQNLKKFLKFCERNGIELVATKKEEITGSKMKGQVVLFTSVRDADLQKWIVQNEGKIASTAKQATMLVIKEGASNNKIDYAIANGIPVLTIDQFKRKYKVAF
jgi:DNA ligase (NAD+)